MAFKGCGCGNGQMILVPWDMKTRKEELGGVRLRSGESLL